MSHAVPACWLAVLFALASPPALAQEAAPAAASVPAFRSAFEGYQPFADAQPMPWRAANETVRARGGWKAYAREAAEPAPAATPDPHAGHAPPQPAAKAPR